MREVLTWSDPLPQVPQRVLVAGCSGAGKTTLCRALHAALGLPHTELDSLFHGPDWVPRPTFVAEVTAHVAQPRWVVEWQYRQVRALVLARADLVVWLDLPRWRVLSQLTWRTVVRRSRGVELWNGNREPPLRAIFTDPEHVVRYAWSTYARGRQQMRAVLADPDGVPVVHLRCRRDVRRWLAGPVAAAAHR